MKITEAQRRALRDLAKGISYGHRFATLDALRKHGLAERETFYATSAYYATATGEIPQRQWRGWNHRWFITLAGSALLLPEDGR